MKHWPNIYIISLIFTIIVFQCAALSAFAAQSTNNPIPLKTTSKMQLRQFKPVTAVMIKKPLKLHLLRPVIPVKPKKPAGPDPKAAIDLADMIDDTDLLEDLVMTCGWDPHLIFQDKKAGNVFYYLPREFRLKHDETGYGLNVQYNHLKDPEKPSVMLTAELAAPHHKGDIPLLKSILKLAFDLKASDKLILKSISGIGATADLDSITSGLMIPPENISLSMPSHLKKTLRLTLALKQDETEEVLAQITREGISGSLKVKIGEEFVPVPINIGYLNFSGKRVDGFTLWADNQPTGKIRNITSFPVKINSINCYRLKQGQLERISKKLKPSTIMPEREKSFKLPLINKLLGNNIMLAWLGTTLDSSCQECMQSVDKKVRKGVAAVPSVNIKFEAIPGVFSDFDIYKIIVQVQSPYFDTEGKKVIIKELELTEENNIHQDMVIYEPENRGAEPLLYRYRLKLITAEGKSFFEHSWHDSHTASQFFGASQIEPVMESTRENQ